MTFCRRARLEFQIWNIVLRPESNIAPPPAFQSISFVFETSQHILSWQVSKMGQLKTAIYYYALFLTIVNEHYIGLEMHKSKESSFQD